MPARPGLEGDNSYLPGTVRTAWRDASLARGWRRPGDWWAEQVDSVAAAAARGEPLDGPCARLGGSRGAAGIGLTEAFDDLWSLFAVLGRTPPGTVVREFAQSYAESAPRRPGCTESVEPLTGLASPPYLRARLGEVYREATAYGQLPVARYALLVVTAAPVSMGQPALATRLALARELLAAFTAGETVAAVCPYRAVVLTPPREPPVPPGLLDAVRSVAGAASGVRPVPLPATLAGAHLLLDLLAGGTDRANGADRADGEDRR